MSGTAPGGRFGFRLTTRSDAETQTVADRLAARLAGLGAWLYDQTEAIDIFNDWVRLAVFSDRHPANERLGSSARKPNEGPARPQSELAGRTDEPACAEDLCEGCCAVEPFTNVAGVPAPCVVILCAARIAHCLFAKCARLAQGWRCGRWYRGRRRNQLG